MNHEALSREAQLLYREHKSISASISSVAMRTSGEVFFDLSSERNRLLKKWRESNDSAALRQANVIGDNLGSDFDTLTRRQVAYRENIRVAELSFQNNQDAYIDMATEEIRSVEVDI